MSTITAERLRDFTATLQKYKAGKASLERRVVAAENWWKLRNRFEEQRRGLGDDGGFRSESGWLHNVIVSKHADAMEAYPEPLILPREPGDAEQARLLSAILQKAQPALVPAHKTLPLLDGTLDVASALTVSYVSQDTSFLKGTLRDYCELCKLNESLFLAVLRKMDVGREQFAKDMSDFSEGQKKKVLIAASLITPAHLYIWDEPLNYIDVFSRMQIEKLIRDFEPTMLIVEHDVRFREQIATECVRIKREN